MHSLQKLLLIVELRVLVAGDWEAIQIEANNEFVMIWRFSWIFRVWTRC